MRVYLAAQMIAKKYNCETGRHMNLFISWQTRAHTRNARNRFSSTLYIFYGMILLMFVYAIYILYVYIFSVRQNDRIRINICFQTMTRAGEIVPYTQLSIFVGRVVWGEIQAGSKWFYNDVVWCWCRTNSYLILIQNAYFAKNYVDYDWKVSLFFSYIPPIS